MEKMKHILFASNLSKDMDAVFKNAAIAALSRDANIVVVHVMEETSLSHKRMKTAFGEQLFKDIKADRLEGARNILVGKKVDALRIRQAIAGFFKGSKNMDTDDTHSLVSKILVTESLSIANEIVTTAVEEECGMIVIGCKQQGVLGEAMGGNLVKKILKRSSVPVLVVPIPR